MWKEGYKRPGKSSIKVGTVNWLNNQVGWWILPKSIIIFFLINKSSPNVWHTAFLYNTQTAALAYDLK
jgi:hypothetical protein